MNCMFVCLLTFLLFILSFFHILSSLLIYFLTRLLLTYLSTSYRLSPFHFETGGRRRQPNLALVFLGSFYVVLYYVVDAH